MSGFCTPCNDFIGQSLRLYGYGSARGLIAIESQKQLPGDKSELRLDMLVEKRSSVFC
jgi:hypothetical protein